MSVNSEFQQHEMRLEKTYPSGAEEWSCPKCGRRFLMQWPPKYKKIVMEPGDEYAFHSGGKGGLQMGLPQIGQSSKEERPFSDELRNMMEDALKDVDFDDWEQPPA